MCADTRLTRCCVAPSRELVRTERMDVSICEQCGSLWADHSSRRDGTPWKDLEVPEEFVGALRQRRLRQATEILERFPELRTGSVLDYGCGQGAFVSTAAQAGVDIVGCDLDVHAPGRLVEDDRLIELPAPWAIPDGTWRTVTLLDVLEHHPDPASFLDALPGEQLLVKVPLATGPLAKAARVTARAGSPALLDALFLVDDVSPHEVLFSSRGLVAVAERAGWQLVRTHRLADVGTELPDRLRMSGPWRSPLLRPLVAGAGGATALLAKAWSDTEVSLFQRNPPVPRDHDATG